MNEQSLPTEPNHYPTESPEASKASEEVLEQIDGSLDFSGGDALLSGKVEASKNQKMPEEEIIATNFGDAQY